MLLLSIILIFVSLIVLCWLLGREEDGWLISEIKLLGFFIVTLALSIVWEYFPLIVPAFAAIALLIYLPLNHLPGVKQFISARVYNFMKPRVPRISETERSVIDSGDLSWEQDLFRGNYKEGVYDKVPVAKLSAAEKGFLANETTELCRLCSPSEVVKHKGLPPAAFEYIKQHKFWGMIIPKANGGLAFSATAQAAIIARLASRSAALGVTVMVPNSLGPGELIMHYGTDKQKKHYLPRLAKGEEIPCFALTSQTVGSDAGGLEDYGILASKTINGKKVMGFNLNFSKRYISLAPVATLIGVAFRAYDPDGLLQKLGVAKTNKAAKDSKKESGTDDLSGDLGITCALIPRNTEGVEIGRHHNPLDIMFHNGPIKGKDVFVPLDDIIGGEKYIGKGWQMLIECLSIGRGISLPSLSNAGAQVTAFTSAAYTNLRQQFGLPVAKFEGVAEKLGQLAINSYAVQAISDNAAAMVTHKLKPAVSSAMAKFYTTNSVRESTTIAMDVHGGKAIMKGDKNYLNELYLSSPIGITVEGANILTRSMIIFGQGFIRCHPYLRAEAEAIAKDNKEGKQEFNKLLWEHFHHITKVKSRAYALAWSGGWTASVGGGELGKHHRRLAILSAQFAHIVELVLLFIGGDIKRKEAISGRFADSWMAMQAGAASIRKWKNDGSPKDVLPLLDAVLEEEEHKAQKSLLGILDNFPGPSFLRTVAKLVRVTLFPLGNNYKGVTDKQRLALATNMARPKWVMKHLAPLVYLGDSKKGDVLAKLAEAHELTDNFLALQKRVNLSGHEKPPYETLENYLAGLVKGKIITAPERTLWLKADMAIQEIISVDDFASL